MLEFSVYKFSTFTIISIEGQDINVKLPYVTGYSDGTFRPNQSIERAEIASLLGRVMDLETSTQQFTYSDVSASHWGLDNIDKVQSKGFMKTDERGNFRPSDSITRVEMSAIISRWLSLESPKGVTPFVDVSSNHWASLAIDQVRHAEIMNGYNDGTFRPTNALTRAEAVMIINRIIGLEPVSNLSTSSFSDVSINHWALGDIEAAASSNKE